MRVLDIDVDDGLVARWRGWLMPERQPFVVPETLAFERGWTDDRAALAFEIVDTFELYGISRDVITRSRYRGLRLERRLVG